MRQPFSVDSACSGGCGASVVLFCTHEIDHHTEQLHNVCEHASTQAHARTHAHVHTVHVLKHESLRESTSHLLRTTNVDLITRFIDGGQTHDSSTADRQQPWRLTIDYEKLARVPWGVQLWWSEEKTWCVIDYFFHSTPFHVYSRYEKAYHTFSLNMLSLSLCLRRAATFRGERNQRQRTQRARSQRSNAGSRSVETTTTPQHCVHVRSFFTRRLSQYHHGVC